MERGCSDIRSQPSGLRTQAAHTFPLQASDRYARTARRKIVNMQRAVAREIRTRCPGRFAEEETSLAFHDFLKTKGLLEAERNDYVKRLEDWDSFSSDALPPVPQLEPPEDGDGNVSAIPESESVQVEGA